jgi:hypothetical protein
MVPWSARQGLASVLSPSSLLRQECRVLVLRIFEAGSTDRGSKAGKRAPVDSMRTCRADIELGSVT